MSFVHLHNHTHYSLLDGLSKPADYAKQAAALGMPGVAITDHGNMHGAVEFYKEVKKVGLKPILGVECYLTPFSRFEKRAGIDTVRNHLVLLAYNNEGYENLLHLTSTAFLEGFYYKPRIDWEILTAHHRGLIALTACLGGELPQAIMAHKSPEEIKAIIERYQRLFGTENFFLELQDRPDLPAQPKVNAALIEWSKQTNAPLVVTNDCHFVHVEDIEAHDILLCMQTDKLLSDENRMTMSKGLYYLRTSDEMRTAFPDQPEALANTLEICQRCEVEIKFGQNLLPVFDCPAAVTPATYLRELCLSGLVKRYQLPLGETELAELRDVVKPAISAEVKEITPEVIRTLTANSYTPSLQALVQRLSPTHQQILERLEYELTIIGHMGFESYFLIVQDFINWAKDHGIAVGPGRGSAAGSIVAYVTGITDLDPLAYELLFERFLNPSRISMPDIDTDFADDQRERVLNYVTQKYGREKVAQIATFGTMAAKQAVKDVGRALGLPFSTMNEFAKLISEKPGTKLANELKNNPEFINAIKSNGTFERIVSVAQKLEGIIRHVSVHACAVVIAKEDLRKYTALQYAPKDENTVITQFPAGPLEDLGLLKMDFLGLRNLTILQKAVDIIAHTRGERLDLPALPLTDAGTFQLLGQGLTTGVFQLESPGMRRYLKKLKPTCFEDIIAMVALYRPGPMQFIDTFIRRKHGQEKVDFPHPLMGAALQNTYGVTVYQEQVMRLSKDMANFTGGQADTLRKAIGKKNLALMAKLKDDFTAGCLQNGISEKISLDVWAGWEKFAEYAFNKSHAACYALIAYQTAYLKHHYPTEFMAALMSSDEDNTDRVVIDIMDCEQIGITVLPPSVNESRKHFTVVDQDKIRFGLKAIKGLGEAPIEAIIAARDSGGAFQTLGEFIRRTGVAVLNKKSLEALIISGALDELGERQQFLTHMDQLLAFGKQANGEASSHQGDLFANLSETPVLAELNLPSVTPATYIQKLKWEKMAMGIYVSGHPLDGLTTYLRKKAPLRADWQDKLNGRKIVAMGIVTKFRKIMTKKNETMLYVTLEDPTGTFEAVLFPRTYQLYGPLFAEDELMLLGGNLERRSGEWQLRVDEAKKLNLDLIRAKALETNLYRAEEKVVRAKTVVEEEEEEPAPPGESEVPNDPPPVARLTLKLGTVDKEYLLRLKQYLATQEVGDTEVWLAIDDQLIKTSYRVADPARIQADVDDEKV